MQKIFLDTTLRAVRSSCRGHVVKSTRRTFQLPPLSSLSKEDASKKQDESTKPSNDTADSVTPLPTFEKNEAAQNDFAAQLEALYLARKAARIEDEARQAAIQPTNESPGNKDQTPASQVSPKDAESSLPGNNRTNKSVVRRVDKKSTHENANNYSMADHIETFQGQLNAHRKAITEAETKTLENLIIQDIPARHTGTIRIISLNRTKAHNALSFSLLRELHAEIASIHAEGHKGPTIRCVILASTHPSSFCAGADLKERRDMSTETVQDFLATLRETFNLIYTLPVPSIAAVSGAAHGGGAELALSAHIRVLGANAMFTLPETALGIIPGAGGTYRLPDIIGHSRALEMILTRRRVYADTANEWGLGKYTEHEQRVEKQMRLDQPRSNEACLARAVSMALAITNGAPLANRAVIQAMVRKERPRGEIEENMAYDSLLETSDRKEGLRAFAEGRHTSFKGE